jgi:hypothetical protein
VTILLLGLVMLLAQQSPPPRDPPTVVARPDASTCTPGGSEQPTAFSTLSWSFCADGVYMMVTEATSPDGQHLLGLREDWYLPDHYFAVTCTYPVDQNGPPVPLGPPTCTDIG